MGKWLVRAIQPLCMDCEARVKVEGKHLEWFKVDLGVRQGCTHHPLCCISLSALRPLHSYVRRSYTEECHCRFSSYILVTGAGDEVFRRAEGLTMLDRGRNIDIRQRLNQAAVM